MIRIIHLSDFHLNPQHLSDWNEYICDALSALINREKEELERTFIVCTGDLLDKGGCHYNNINDAFNLFKSQVLDAIVNHTGITLDHFIIIPGNHDIERDADKKFENSGLRVEFQSKGAIEINKYAKQYIDTSDRQGARRIVKYKEFESQLYSAFPNIMPSFLGSTFKYTINGETIGFAGFNSVWNAYDDDDNKDGLVIGEPQYNKCINDLNDCRIKIALMHHPLDWMKYEKDTIGKWLYKDFNLLLIGHVHDGDTSMETKLAGSLFTNIAPSCTSDIRESKGTFANGVSIIDYDYDNRIIDCSYYIYSLKDKSYILNTSLAENGKCHFVIPNPSSSNLQDITDNALSYIRTTILPLIDSNIIPQKANVIKSLKDAFVMPPIKKHGVLEEDTLQIDLNYILKNKANQAFFCPHESGKTILLYRILLEFVENYNQHNLIPIYIDFEDMGNKDIETIIKNFTDLNSKQVKELLSAQQIILLIDNYNPTVDNTYKTQRLYNWIKDNNTRIIVSVKNDLIATPPISFIQGNNQIAFEWFYIEHLKSSHVKELMMKWSPEDELFDRNSKLEKMVTKFSSYSLPCTAMSVSLYLWSTESAGREPINQAVLLDIYIEIILEKLNKENVYRNTFDYENKTMLLARIAKEMSEQERYEVDYSDYLKCIETYLKDVGFTSFQADRLGNYFIAQKVFVRTGNIVKFAHSCFYHFFIAKRMLNDEGFKKHVLESEFYYKYHRAIDYYTGLRRNDEDTLQLIHTRFVDFFKPVEPIYDEINIDECFTNIIKNRPAYVPVATAVNVEKVKALKPTQEKVEQQLNNYCDDRLSKISDDFSKFQRISPDQLIIMMSNILRNSEGVENVGLKQEVYNSIIKNILVWAIIIKDGLASYANTHDGKLPIQFESIRNVEAYFRFMPLIMQLNLNTELGTSKLNSIFKAKIVNDRKSTASDVEKFMSVAMYWDNHGEEYDKEIKSLIRNIGRNSVQDYLLVKLLNYFNNHTKKGSDEERLYINLISDLRIKNDKLPKRLKDKIIKLLVSEKKVKS